MNLLYRSITVSSHYWKTVKVFKTQVDKGMLKAINLMAEQHRYQTTNSKCSYESYFDCVDRTVTTFLRGSSSECSIISFPSLPICQINKTNEEVQEFQQIQSKANGQCAYTKNCINLEYSGEETDNVKRKAEILNFRFFYRLPSNSIKIYEEYFIYDTISTIGAVGGTLGMCIGFSFTSLISSLLNILKNMIYTNNPKIANKKLSKSKNQNGLFNDKQLEDKLEKIMATKLWSLEKKMEGNSFKIVAMEKKNL